MPGLEYRWVVVGVSTAVAALAWAVRATFALFYVAMLEEFGWGRGPTALGYSLSWLGFVLFAPIAGWLSDRWGTRRVVTAGGLVLGAGLALTGGTASLGQYYAGFGLLGAAGLAGMLVPSTTIVTRWFARSRGTAMGVLSAGNSAGAVVFYPLDAWLIAALGWREALAASGGGAAATGVPGCSKCFTRVIRSCGWNGLRSSSSAFTAKALSATARFTTPDIKITGVFPNRGCCLMCWQTS